MTGLLAHGRPGSDKWVSQTIPHADLISVQNSEQYYVGFFASRNAKITVSDASLTTSKARTVASKPAGQTVACCCADSLACAKYQRKIHRSGTRQL